MPKPVILGPDGVTPLQAPPKEVLTGEISKASLGSARSILSGHPADGLTPDRLAVLLRSAEDGDAESYLELAEQMEERDLHYLSVLGTRKRQVAQLPISVEAASDSAEHQAHADLIRDWLLRDSLEDELVDLLDSLGKGFAVTEIVWELGERWLPKALKWRDPRWFEFDRHDGETLMLKGAPNGQEGGGSTRTPLSAFPYKFVVHRQSAKSGLAIRGGFARAVAWGYLFKNYGLKDWVSFCEIFGMPFRLGKYDPGTDEEAIATLMRAVASVSTDAAAVIPKSMEIDFIQANGTSSGEVYDRLLAYLDRQVSKAVLGQTATTDADIGGLGSGKEHGEVRADIERADAKGLSGTLNRDVVVAIIQLNFGPQQIYPRIKIGREETVDVSAMTTALQGLVPLGLKVGMSTVRDRLGFPDPEPGEEVLAPRAAEPQNPPEKTRAGAGGPELPENAGKAPAGVLRPSYFDVSAGRRGGKKVASIIAAAVAQNLAGEADAVDEAADAIASEAGRAILAPLIDPMLAAIEAGASFEEARQLLERAAASMDERELSAALEQACLVARAGGMSGL